MISIEVSVDSAIRRCLIYIESNMDLTYWTWTRGGGTPIHYLYGYVQPKGVVIWKLLI